MSQTNYVKFSQCSEPIRYIGKRCCVQAEKKTTPPLNLAQPTEGDLSETVLVKSGSTIYLEILSKKPGLCRSVDLCRIEVQLINQEG